MLTEKAKQKGTDDEFLAYIRKFPSCLSNVYSEYVNGEGRCEAAHVRRAYSGAGVAGKPPYSAIPLTNWEHAMQHQKGEGVFCPPEWYDSQVKKYLIMWINGVEPPEPESEGDLNKEYIIEYAGQVVALWLLLQKHFSVSGAYPIKLTLQRVRKKRSNAQNRAQWGLLYKDAMSHYKEFPGDLAIDALESLRFGVNEDFIHEMFKRMFNEGKSTRMNTVESNKYAMRIREYFLHKYKKIIREPINYEQQYIDNLGGY